MDVTDQTASGPAEGNAGKADSGVSLDDAILSAMGGTETETSAQVRTADGEQPDAAQDKPAEDAGKPVEPAKDQAQEAAPEGNADAAEAPKHWPAERRQAFAALPKEAQEIVKGFVKDLTGGYTRKSQELSDKARFADNVRSLFSDSDRAEMQRHGADELQAVKVLVGINQFAQRDPVGYIKWAMQHFRVAPDQILPQQQGQKQPEAEQQPSLDDLLVDPKVKTLESELNGIKAMIANAQAQQYQGHVNSLRTAIGSFRSALDDQGQLRYPHFDQVSRAMGALMEGHPQLASMPDSYEKLDIAYRMAIRADPELADTVIESEVSKRLADKVKREEAERARRVGGMKQPLGAPATRPKAASLDDAIGAAMSQAGF